MVTKIIINLLSSFLFGALIGHLSYKGYKGYEVSPWLFVALFVLHFIHYFTKP